MKVIISILMLINLSCKSNKEIINKKEHNITTKLEMYKSTFKVGEPIPITFSVQNNIEHEIEFCYWQTPLEKELTANCFKIVYKGNTLPYQGKQVKRKPPTKKDNLVLKSKQTVSQEININDGYNLDKLGTYTIRFLGRVINGLPDSKSINFTIHKKRINRHEAIEIAKQSYEVYANAVNPPRHFIVDAETGSVIRMNIAYSPNPKKMILEEYIAMYGKDRGDSEIAVWEIILKYEWTKKSTKITVKKVNFLKI